MSWLVDARALAAITICAMLLGLRNPSLGLVLEAAGVVGVVNARLVIRANEGLLDGRVSRARRSLWRMLRLTALGAFVALVLARGPRWSIAAAAAGLYAPYLFAASALTARRPDEDP